MALVVGGSAEEYDAEYVARKMTSIARSKVGVSVQRATYYKGTNLAPEEEFVGTIGPTVGEYNPEVDARFIQEW